MEILPGLSKQDRSSYYFTEFPALDTGDRHADIHLERIVISFSVWGPETTVREGGVPGVPVVRPTLRVFQTGYAGTNTMFGSDLVNNMCVRGCNGTTP